MFHGYSRGAGGAGEGVSVGWGGAARFFLKILVRSLCHSISVRKRFDFVVKYVYLRNHIVRIA